MFAVMRDIYWVPQRFEEVGDDVVAIVESRGQGKQSGMDTRALVVHTWTLPVGRIVRWHIRVAHADPEDLPRLTRLEASGESAQRAPEPLCRL